MHTKYDFEKEKTGQIDHTLKSLKAHNISPQVQMPGFLLWTFEKEKTPYYCIKMWSMAHTLSRRRDRIGQHFWIPFKKLIIRYRPLVFCFVLWLRLGTLVVQWGCLVMPGPNRHMTQVTEILFYVLYSQRITRTYIYIYIVNRHLNANIGLKHANTRFHNEYKSCWWHSKLLLLYF